MTLLNCLGKNHILHNVFQSVSKLQNKHIMQEFYHLIYKSTNRSQKDSKQSQDVSKQVQFNKNESLQPK